MPTTCPDRRCGPVVCTLRGNIYDLYVRDRGSVTSGAENTPFLPVTEAVSRVVTGAGIEAAKTSRITGIPENSGGRLPVTPDLSRLVTAPSAGVPSQPVTQVTPLRASHVTAEAPGLYFVTDRLYADEQA